MDYRIKLGRNLRDIRLNSGLTYEELAFYFGIHKELIKEFELGNEPVPTLILAEYLEIKETNGELVRQYNKNFRRR